MRKILIILAMLMLISAIDAKEPEVGDLVNVVAGNTEYEGKITGMSNGLMCLDARLMEVRGEWVCTPRCFGIGQIKELSWLNETT